MNIEQQIYTSCPYGEGYDGISGFQVKARSKGITDSVSRALLRYSNHYHVPRELRSLEYNYYQEGKELPPEFLARFPYAVTYHLVEENLYALTRVQYVGKDYSGRPGNFLAHTLVFAPEALEPFEYNPIALSRSPVFENPPEDGTVLDSLPDFHGYAPEVIRTDGDWMNRVSKESYAASYEAVLSAVVQQLHQNRPIIFCFKDYSEAVDYIEALLMLLPVEMRCRTTFTSYEPEPDTLIKRGDNEDTTDNLHLVTTIDQEKGGLFEFRPHEINKFLVWDFAGEHYSKFPDPSPYTQAVIKLCARAQPVQLRRWHTFLEQIGAGRIPDSWDALILSKGLENKLSMTEDRQLVPTIMETVVRVALTESQVNLALDLAWPLLQKTAMEETDELFPTVHKTFDLLLERLANTSVQRLDMKKRLVELVCHFIVSGSISRAHMLASLGQISPRIILSEAATQLEKENWPQLSVQTGKSDFHRILKTLDQLAQEPGMLEWVVQTLWQKVKLLAGTALPDNNFHQFLEIVAPLMEQLPPGSDLADSVPHEAGDLIQHLLKKGFPSRALRLFDLSGNDAETVLPGIYNKLISKGWPGNLTVNQASRSDDQKAYQKILDVVVTAIFKYQLYWGSLFQRLVPAFRIAHLYDFADQLWLRFKTDLLDKLSAPFDKSAAVSFVETIKDILTSYNCPDEIFELLLWQTDAQTPGSLQQWKQRVSEFTELVVLSNAPAQRAADLLELIGPPLGDEEQIILLAVIFHNAPGFPHLQAAVREKYEIMLKASESSESQWGMRLVLVQDGEKAWHLLMNDFIGSLKPWAENGREYLEEWQSHILSTNPGIISFAATFLARGLAGGRMTADEINLSMAYLELFAPDQPKQCLPLLLSFLSTAPMETLAANRKPWFNQAQLPHPEYPAAKRAKQRVRLIFLLEEIETSKSTGNLDSAAAIDFLQQWQKLQLELDAGARDWAAPRLLDLFGKVDLSASEEFKETVEACLRIHQEQTLQEAVDYLKEQPKDDPVTLILQLVIIGEAGLKETEDPDSIKLAEIVREVTTGLPLDKCAIFWKLLEDLAEASVPPATEAFESFRRMVKPKPWFARKSSQLFNRLFRRCVGRDHRSKKNNKGENHAQQTRNT
jgi:hypothetical protein